MIIVKLEAGTKLDTVVEHQYFIFLALILLELRNLAFNNLIIRQAQSLI